MNLTEPVSPRFPPFFAKSVPDLAHRAVPVVGQHVHQDRHATRPVALEGYLLVAHAFELAGTALDSALDVIRRHVFRFGRQNRGSQARIGVRVTPALGRYRNFLHQTSKNLAALGIQRALLVLDCGPFRVA